MSNTFALPPSKVFSGIEWLSGRIPYPDLDIKGDTFPMTWADDDNIYTSAGDPLWPADAGSGLDVQRFTGGATDYKITKVQPMRDYVGWGGDGPKPSGMICVEGILYLAFQNMRRNRKPLYGLLSQHGSDAHIIYSTDHGGLWKPALANIPEPMFPGHLFGGPSFINFGQNNANARDNYVYAISGDQWDNGSNLRLGRVPADSIIRREAWEWVCAWTPAGQPAWHPELSAAIPILSLHRYLGLPEMVYVAGLERYLLLTWRLHQDFNGDEGTDLLILEAPQPWGPFSLVHFEEYWEGKDFTPYCPRLPLKWMSADGLAGYLQFSGSWTARAQKLNFYRSNVRQFRLKLR